MQRYAITDRSFLPPHRHGMEAAFCVQVEQWVSGGVEWIQLREKSLPQDALTALVRRLARITREKASRTRLLVNGLPPQLALENGAHGVHLPGGALAENVSAARFLGASVTVSCHLVDEVQAARAGGADAVLWAPVFGKVLLNVKVRAGTGLQALRQACEVAAPMPVFALGGVTLESAEACIGTGAVGVAGIRLFHGRDWRNLP